MIMVFMYSKHGGAAEAKRGFHLGRSPGYE